MLPVTIFAPHDVPVPPAIPHFQRNPVRQPRLCIHWHTVTARSPPEQKTIPPCLCSSIRVVIRCMAQARLEPLIELARVLWVFPNTRAANWSVHTLLAKSMAIGRVYPSLVGPILSRRNHMGGSFMLYASTRGTIWHWSVACVVSTASTHIVVLWLRLDALQMTRITI
ncbi:hypothetical protein C2E23DRAFT_432299 [Lenzites betulinus]|nr:hypothetical protein C2E23DRAFT_432299 [Lenzites betulinus]